jgi:hypothetical protein
LDFDSVTHYTLIDAAGLSGGLDKPHGLHQLHRDHQFAARDWVSVRRQQFFAAVFGYLIDNNCKWTTENDVTIQ